MGQEKFTWAKLKEIANNMPEEMLFKEVIIWEEDGETAHHISGHEILEEDHLFDGDEGIAPESVIKENYDDYEENKDEYYLVHPKGFPILHIPSQNPVV